MKRIFIVSLVLITTMLGAILLQACASPAPAPTPSSTSPGTSASDEAIYKWRVSGAIPITTIGVATIKPWADYVRKASGGRIDIQVFGGGDIVPASEMWDAVAEGALDMAVVPDFYYVGKTPVTTLAAGFPYTTRGPGDYYALQHVAGLADVIRKAYAEHNIYFITSWPHMSMTLMSTFPVTKAADFEGRKLRATIMEAEVLSKAGAATVFLPIGDVYGALEKGLIEGVVTGPPSFFYEMGFHEHSKYLLTPFITSATSDSIWMNLEKWNELPEDLQAIIYTSTAYLADIMSAEYLYDSSVKLKKMEEDWGITVTTMPEEEVAIMAGYAIEVMDKYSAEDAYFAEGAKIVKDYMKLIGILKD